MMSHFSYAETHDLIGLWRSIDDKTSFSKSIIEIKKDSNGNYSGKILEVIPRPDYTAKTLCNNYPAPYTN